MLRLGGSHPPPQHPPHPLCTGAGTHARREASPTLVLSDSCTGKQAPGNARRLLGHAVAVPGCRAALPGQTLPRSAPRLSPMKLGTGQAGLQSHDLLPSGLHLPPHNNQPQMQQRGEEPAAPSTAELNRHLPCTAGRPARSPASSKSI